MNVCFFVCAEGCDACSLFESDSGASGVGEGGASSSTRPDSKLLRMFTGHIRSYNACGRVKITLRNDTDLDSLVPHLLLIEYQAVLL